MKSKPLPSEINGVKILKDLGQQFSSDTSTRKIRYCVIECISCKAEHRASVQHVLKGNIKRCFKCGSSRASMLKNIKSKDTFIEKAIKAHQDKYSYECSEYTKKDNHVKIYCRKCNRYFIQRANDHLKGHGCSICSKASSDYNVFYIWKILGTDIYKLGVTSERLGNNRIETVLQQYCKVYGKSSYEIIEKFNVNEANIIETLLLKKFINNPINHIFDGCTEFRTLNKSELNIIKALCALYRLNDNGEYKRNLEKAKYYIETELQYLEDGRD